MEKIKRSKKNFQIFSDFSNGCIFVKNGRIGVIKKVI